VDGGFEEVDLILLGDCREFRGLSASVFVLSASFFRLAGAGCTQPISIFKKYFYIHSIYIHYLISGSNDLFCTHKVKFP
jgi:hypothetical protein